MSGTMTFQALIPVFTAEWALSKGEAGWVSGVAYAGYVVAVPVLMTLTDRIDARRIVLAFAVVAAASSLGYALLAQGFWSALVFRVLNGVALAGTYMPGLKALTDRTEGPRKGRYQSLYTATFSVGSAVSLFQAGVLAGWLGWRWAFAVAGALPLGAVLVVALLVRPVPPPAGVDRGGGGPMLDVRPVLRNREAMAYVLGYAAHCWELFGFRTWLVAFLTFSAGLQVATISDVTITTAATAVLLLGLPASVLGNEAATRFGRRRVLIAFMLASAALALALGFAAPLPFWLVLALAALYGVAVMTDSASLTVGTVNAARPERRGATMAVHTTLGSLMAFLSPLASGFVLDASGGGASVGSWVAGFAVLGAGVALGPLALYLLAPPEGEPRRA